MKKHFFTLFAATLLPVILLAQVSGDYRSAVNGGNWGTAGTWEKFNGTTWATATSAPSSSNNVTIRNGFNVVLDASGKNCADLIVEAGATFTAGVGLPTSSIRYVRVNGDTAKIDGTFGDPVNGDVISLENANTSSALTIMGSGTFAPARVRSYSNARNTKTIFDIDTKFMYTGSTGSGGVALYPQTGNDTIVVNAGKTLTFVDKANMGVGSSSSSPDTLSVCFIINGTVDLSQPNNTLNLRTVGVGKTSTLIIGASGSVMVGHNFYPALESDTGSTVITNDGSLSVGGTADFSNPNVYVGGTGTFTLNSGATINIGAAVGLDATNGPIRTTTRSFSAGATYAFIYDSVNQVTGTDFPAHVANLVVSNTGDTVSLSANVKIDTLTISSGAILATKTGDTLTISDTGSVSGTMINYSSIITNDTISFNSGSTYVHAVNAASIPWGMWNAGSTCMLTGIAGNAPSNGNQNFYNVVWNSPNQSGNLNMGWNGNTIGGDITVVNTGSSRWQMCAPSSGNAATVTIMGDVNVSGGQFTTNGTGNGNTTITINHHGNINVTGGNFSISRGSQGATGTSTWNLLAGNFSMSNATTQNSNTTPAGAKFVFAKKDTQSLILGAGNTLTSLPIEVSSGTTLNLDTNVVKGSGIFTLDSGATILSGHPDGLNGSIAVSGTVTLSKMANYSFAGTAAQVTGAMLPDTINNLTIDNAAGVALTSTTMINGVLTLKAGVFNNTVPFLLGANGSISLQGGSLLIPLLGNIQLVTIAEARKDANNDLIPDYKVSGDTLKITGVVTSPVISGSNLTQFIQDGTGGIEVFQFGLLTTPFAVGDSIFVIGKVNQFHGLDEFSPLALDSNYIGLIKHSAVKPAPMKLTLHQYVANAEAYEGMLVEIDTLYKASGTWASGSNVYVTNLSKSDTTILYINSSTTVAAMAEPTFPINLVGIASQYSSGSSVYNDGYEIIPRDTNDIKPITVLGVAKNEVVPIEYKMYQNYPNPFNPSTTINFTVAKEGNAKVRIYNALGQEVATVYNDIAEPGRLYTVQFNASSLASGMYFSVFESQGHRETKKMLLMK